MDQHNMTKLNSLLKTLLSKTALCCAVFAALVAAYTAPLFAQTAEVKKVGVYYMDQPTDLDSMYCDFGGITGAAADRIENRSFVPSPTPDGNQVQPTGEGANDHNGDPWVSSALIEYDQPYPSDVPNANKYPNHCLGLCMDVYCNNLPLGQATYSISFPLQQVRFEIIKYYNNTNVYNPEAATPVHTIDLFPGSGQDGAANLSKYMCGSYKCTNATTKTKNNTSFGICIGAQYVCDYGSYETTGVSSSQGTYTGTGDSTGDSHTEAYGMKGGWCWNKNVSRKDACGTPTAGQCVGSCQTSDTDRNKQCLWRDKKTCGNGLWATTEVWDSDNHNWNSNCMFFNNDGAESHTPIQFCASWDGHYEHSGEMGKSNGQFAFRGRVQTSAPGDDMITTGNIEVDSMMVYPAMNQIPIQVDVTNVHTVRSTPSLVGQITKVTAAPYTLVYRLSKDADVRIAIFDGETKDDAIYAYASNANQQSGHSTNEVSGAPATYNTKPVRTLVDWQPRVGEGMLGSAADAPVNEFENWDGRNDDGMLLPAGNYVVTLQAKSQDEWPGIDFSRAVTRQLSLDPLKLTDVRVTGLTKKSTAYATITYVPTESSTVYWEVYTPGTVFDATKDNAIDTDSSTPTGTAPKIQEGTGSLVFRSQENRTGRMAYSSRWDGTCQAYNDDGTPGNCTITVPNNGRMSNGQTCTTAGGCPETFAHGAPLPDGNYVYVLWAEVPYNGKYLNLASGEGPAFTPNATCTGSGTEVNNQCFTGVKTLKYSVGTLEIERGLVGITIEPVSYSTVGSSPTAYGLDPFIFKYALERDAQGIATVQNTAGVVVRYLTPQTGTANVSQQLNTLSWDGRDEQGRMVAPGTYWFVVEAYDAMFPAMKNRASAVFPVDMYHVVDVNTTDVYGDSNAKATISYLLSKAMNVQINIYNKDVVIPAYNRTTGDYGTNTGNQNYAWPPRVCNTTTDADVFDGGHVDPSKVAQRTDNACIYVNDINFTYYPTSLEEAADTRNLHVRLQPIKTIDRSATKNGDGMLIMEEWDALYFYNPTPSPDTHTAEVVNRCSGADAKDRTFCPYETVPDGQYPFFISARSDEPFSRYYYNSLTDGNPFNGENGTYTVNGEPFKKATADDGNDYADVKQESFLYATEKPVGRLNITRGPVYFLDGSVVVYPNAPQVFNASTGPTFIPPYEIDFSVSRAAEVEIAIVALKDGVCSPVSTDYTTGAVNATDGNAHDLYPNNGTNPSTQSAATNANGRELKTNVAGQICKFLSTMTIANVGDFDANIVRKAYWDGTDHTGHYVTPGIYEVRLTARNYPNNGAYQPTVKSVPVNAKLFQVFDLLDSDSYAISVRDTDMHIGYQISVPMKVGVQIFKPGTTIYDYSKGTLRNPTTGHVVKDIREVLVRSIVGIRPSMTLIDEIWDGRDYAQQEVPDGTYPFRFVTAINSADIDSMTGEIIPGNDQGTTNSNSATTNTEASSDWKINYVADTYEYQNLHKATVAIGDGKFVCEDWEKTVFFYPNPLKEADKGTLEITKMPVPGTLSIKYYNLAGDLVRDGGYTCIDANNYWTTMEKSLMFYPDNDPQGSSVLPETTTVPGQPSLATDPNVRNAAMRCKWNATNQHGKKVARGVYFGLVDFKAKAGREHCQKVVKIIVP